MTRTGRWTLAAISAAAVLVSAFLIASDLTKGEANIDEPFAAIAGLIQVLGVTGVAIIFNVAAIPGPHDDPRPVQQDWAKPYDA